MRLSTQQLSELEEQGFLVVENVLDPARDLDPILQEMNQVLDLLLDDLVANGTITKEQQDAIQSQTNSTENEHWRFDHRLCELIRMTGNSFSQNFDFSLPKGLIDPDAPLYLGRAIFELIAHHQELLECVQSVVEHESGEEETNNDDDTTTCQHKKPIRLYSNPVQHIRLKPPASVGPVKAERGSVKADATPWHQDSGVLTSDADETQVWTVWIPLGSDVDEFNGCLQVVPKSHQEFQTVVPHCPLGAGILSIPDTLIDKAHVQPVPMKRGSILILHRRLFHASVPNLTDHLRSSLDLRYQPAHQPTGRSYFPGMVVGHDYKNEKDTAGAVHQDQKEQELEETAVSVSHEEWQRLWYEARRILSAPENQEIWKDFDRWHTHDGMATHDMCA